MFIRDIMVSGKRAKERNAGLGSAFCFEDMKIGIRLSNEALGLRLAKRIAELAPGTEAVIGHSEGEFDLIIEDEDLKEIFPVSEALDRMEGEYFRRTGKRLQRSNKGPRGLFIFTSQTGGSGLTAVSFTFSRILSGKLNAKVIYMDLDSFGPLEYLEQVRGSRGSSAELMYLLKSGAEVRTDEYFAGDRYGPDVITLRDPDRETLLRILDDPRHEYAVISGKHVPLKADAVIEVVNERDRRRPAPYEKADLRVFNRGTGIPDDEASFTENGGQVRIDMSGDFAMALGKLMKEVTDGYGYGRTEKNGA